MFVPFKRHGPFGLAILSCTLSTSAWCEDMAASVVSQLDRVQIVARHYDNAIGTSDAASQGSVRAELLRSRAAQRPGEVLEFVPGVIVTQHSGDGKANQYFLRGFNLDHGTDFATSINGMPVNMPTHAHGQGYTDLNFLIPELVDRIEYRKGPYFATTGDFSAAGAADIIYRKTLERPFTQLTWGERQHRRLLGAGSREVTPGISLLGAVDLHDNDGPWTVAEGLRRLNGLLTLSAGTALAGWSSSVMHYDARWTSTDQVPERLIAAGYHDGRPFGRYDSLDPTDGGSTQRTSLSGEWHRRTDSRQMRVSAYAVDYGLSLWSNFTYALERPDNGDQFSQHDRRRVYGAAASHAMDHALGRFAGRTEFGLQARHDRIAVGLFDTERRTVLTTTREDRVRETMLGLYGQTSVELAPKWRGTAGLRADHARFDVESISHPSNSGSATASLLSPKLSLVAGPWEKTEFFFNAGRGFHSNDARGTTATVDPRTLDAVDRVPGFATARGMELGARTEWLPGLQSSLAWWKLNFESELVYVGDAGATEANRPSKRHGVEWNTRYIPLPWLLIDVDLAWSKARFRDSDPAGDRIPNAVDKVGSVALTARELGPWAATLHWRYLGSSALIENNSVRSRPSLTTNLRVGYRMSPDAEVMLDLFNIFDARVNDIEYFYESRLPGDAEALADRHVHPGEPRTARLTVKMNF